MIMGDIPSLAQDCPPMATPSLTASPGSVASGRPALDKKTGPFTYVVFFAVLAMGLLFTAYSLMHDMHELGTVVTTWTPFLLLGVALLIALGFEFVNGFHDTANAVATVIVPVRNVFAT